ncbi:hypothetical protein D3C87_1395950 [compost metagenome]
MRKVERAERGAHHGTETVRPGNCLNDGLQCLAMPAALPLDLQAGTQIRAPGADAELVRRTAVLGLVDGIGPFVDQAGIAPTQPNLQDGALGRNGQPAVMIREGNIELVRFHPTIIGELDVD